jgi:Asp-tRNA(Asn)/Glu-tRNA(Gln) amidotransferase A subunit family amidase
LRSEYADGSRRRFVACFSSLGLSTTLLPGVLWARLQQEGARRVTPAMLRDALLMAGLDVSDEDQGRMLPGINQSFDRYRALRAMHIDDEIGPPLYFSPIVPGTRLDRTARPFRPTSSDAVRRPANLEDVALWPITSLAHLVKTRQVTSVELTSMYLDRLKRLNPTLNCVVTFTDDLAMKEARQADADVAAGRYRGLLHGIPWGCKDIIAVPGYPTQLGSSAFAGQVIDTEATVVRLLRDAGAVLVAKLTTGDLIQGDRWFGGRTNNPWKPSEGSGGSSAGPASATAAGCVAFAIGSDTGGSILGPSVVCGVTGLRPTFGRVSRFGAASLSWSQDRIGPLCRSVEDCAVVFHAIARADENDLSVVELPFNWDGSVDVRRLRVGYVAAAFREDSRHDDWRRNDTHTLDAVKALGVTLEPFDLPEVPLTVTDGLRWAESGASFDVPLRDGRLQKSGNTDRVNGFRVGRLELAVEYLQAQRVRAMIMRRFAGVVSKFDVYIAPYMNARDPGRGGPGVFGAPPPASVIAQHFQISNLCGYPALAVPNGFTADGTPTGITFLGRLYAESQILALAKAYQDRAGWHLKHPPLALESRR